jgi:hypothetical protein
MSGPFVVGRLALCVGLGVVVVGQGIALPTLEGGSGLVDANLAHSLGRPIADRLGVVLVAACAVATAIAAYFSGDRPATLLGLAATALALFDRALLLPRVHAAWARVDLVAGRPYDRFVEAQALASWHAWSLWGVAALLAVSVCLRAGTLAPRPAPPLSSADAASPGPA